MDSHPVVRQVTATWYNNKHTGPDGTRDETRITGWGGAASALLDPDSTGALAVFVFDRTAASGSARVIRTRSSRIWSDRLSRSGLSYGGRAKPTCSRHACPPPHACCGRPTCRPTGWCAFRRRRRSCTGPSRLAPCKARRRMTA
ncbi:EcoRII N-terminal effector-binding domain-containing protein [Brevundimonas sp. NPDC090276]|uniref:EcoRII N-terminal effector-binding domain-containing protein n=1 Tax=Brevundimonas sp. NPDC090276 TaxID=3363956 RepID=UPI003839DE63